MHLIRTTFMGVPSVGFYDSQGWVKLPILGMTQYFVMYPPTWEPVSCDS